jgi:hypothetical protein
MYKKQNQKSSLRINPLWGPTEVFDLIIDTGITYFCKNIPGNAKSTHWSRREGWKLIGVMEQEGVNEPRK